MQMRLGKSQKRLCCRLSMMYGWWCYANGDMFQECFVDFIECVAMGGLVGRKVRVNGLRGAW